MSTIYRGNYYHNNLVLIEKLSGKEGNFTVEEIKNNKFGIYIRNNDLSKLDIGVLERQLKANIDYDNINYYENYADVVAEIILNTYT